MWLTWREAWLWRAYSSANVAMGRQLTVLEAELRELRLQLAATEQPGLRTRLRELPAVAAQESYGPAEQRLSQLIRSRLATLRPG